MENNLETNAGAIDLNVERAKLASAKAAVQEHELVIAQEELRLAEQSHASALEECRTAQTAFDRLDAETNEAQHLALQAATAKEGAAKAIDTHRRNPPTTRFDSGRPLSQLAMKEWREELPKLIAKKESADAAHTQAFATLQRLQGERRLAGTALETASWRASDAATVMAGLRAKLAKMQPRPVFAPQPWHEAEPVDNAIGTLRSAGIQPY